MGYYGPDIHKKYSWSVRTYVRTDGDGTGKIHSEGRIENTAEEVASMLAKPGYECPATGLFDNKGPNVVERP